MKHVHSTCFFQARLSWISLCLALSLALSLGACQFDPGDPIRWDAEVLVPIAYSEIGINQLISDTSLLASQSDQSIHLIYRDTLTRTSFREVFEVPDTTIIRQFDLENFELADQVIEQRITLAQLARNLSAQGNIAGDIILLSHGNTLPSLQGIPGLSSGVIEVDASDLFEYASLIEGEMEVRIANFLPLGLENISLRLRNRTLESTILEDQYPVIPSRDSLTRSYSLAEKEVESGLDAEMLNLDIQGSQGQPVLIDTNDYVKVILTVRDLKASEARAIFPDQTVSEETEDLVYEFTGEQADVALKQIRVRSGFIRAEIISTIEDTIQFSYSLPQAMKDGQFPLIQRKIPPAPPGGNAELTEVFDLSGYDIDLTKGGTTINTMEQSYQIDLVYSGKVVQIDLQDSVYARFQLVDIVPDYVQGYLGSGNLKVAGTEQLSIFEDGEVAGVNFENATARLTFFNSMGLDIYGQLNVLTARREALDKEVSLSGILLASPIHMPGPDLSRVGETEATSLELTPSNSNIRDLVNVFPDEITYDLEVAYNLYGPDALEDDFVTFDSELTSFLELEMPVYGTLEGISFRDTSAVAFQGNATEEIAGGSLKLLFDNEFPLTAVVFADLVDENYEVVHRLVDGQTIDAALAEGDGRILSATSSVIEQSFTQQELQRIIDQARHLLIRYTVKTGATSVRLYDDYHVQAKLVGQFTYGVN